MNAPCLSPRTGHTLSQYWRKVENRKHTLRKERTFCASADSTIPTKCHSHGQVKWLMFCTRHSRGRGGDWVGCRPVWAKDKDCVSETCKARERKEEELTQTKRKQKTGVGGVVLPHLLQLPRQTWRTEFYGRARCSSSLWTPLGLKLFPEEGLENTGETRLIGANVTHQII